MFVTERFPLPVPITTVFAFTVLNEKQDKTSKRQQKEKNL
jgi:hypothetical protein